MKLFYIILKILPLIENDLFIFIMIALKSRPKTSQLKMVIYVVSYVLYF